MKMLGNALDKAGQLVYQLFGIRQEDGQDSDYVPSPVRAMREITEVESFASILPYAAYFKDENFFVLDSGDRDVKKRDHALGFAIELSPQTGATIEMITSLLPMYGEAPINSNAQVSLYASDGILDRLRASAMLRHGHPNDGTEVGEHRSGSIGRVLIRNRIEHLHRGTKVPVLQNVPVLVRDFRIVYTLSVPCDLEDPQIFKQLKRLRKGLHATFRAAQFDCWDWGADDLINWVAELTNPDKRHLKTRPIRKTYDPGRQLRHQIIDNNTICRPTDDGKSLRYGMPGTRSEVHSRLYTATSYPDEFPLWAMGNVIGDFYETQMGYPCPFVITIGVHTLERESNKAIAQLKGVRATTNATSQMARFMPEYKDQKRAYDIIGQAYKENGGEVEMYHQVLLMARPEDIDSSERAAQQLWRRAGFNLVNQQYIQVPGLVASLPLGFSPTLRNFYKRFGLVCKKVTNNAVNMSPLLAEWKGTKTPVINLVGRRGQLMSFCLFDSNGNFNFAIAAPSGKGKSVLANEITISYLSLGALVFIIDVGRSYEKLCRLLDGEFIEFRHTETRRICINPFWDVVDIEDDMEALKPLVAQMAAPSGELNDEDRSVIEEAIMSVWRRLGRHMTITDVAAALKAMGDPVAVRLGRQLYPFTRDGMYGSYFDGPSNVDFTKSFVVLELEELKQKKDLQAVVLFVMMFRITQAMYHEKLERRKICLIDEAWDLMSGGNSAKFIEEGYRRARKREGCFGTITQSVLDYYKNPASQAALENSDWVFLLEHKSEQLEQLAASKKLVIDDNLMRVLRSVRTEKGVYSEIYVKSPVGSGVGRLVLDPFSLLLYSTDPNDRKAIDRYRNQGMSVTDAVAQVLKDRKVYQEEEFQ